MSGKWHYVMFDCSLLRVKLGKWRLCDFIHHGKQVLNTQSSYYFLIRYFAEVRLIEESSLALPSDSQVGEPNKNFVTCMAKCVGKSVEEIKKWYQECKRKVKCWVKKVGVKAAKCVGKCILVREIE